MDLSVSVIEQALGRSFESTAHDCHGTSLALLRADLPELRVGGENVARIMRGRHRLIDSQHSWLVLGDAYDRHAPIVDATLWSYDGSPVPRVAIYEMGSPDYLPHGQGRFSHWRRSHPQPESDGARLELSPEAFEALSDEAIEFLDSIEPLDARGWHWLGTAAVCEWPSAEIIRAMWLSPGLRAFAPIDKVGMLTDLNPGGVWR